MRRRKGIKKRRFFALLQSTSSVEQKAVRLGKKRSRAQAEAQINLLANNNWDVLLLMASGARWTSIADSEQRKYYFTLQDKIINSRFTNI